jgi:hypothetical protein
MQKNEGASAQRAIAACDLKNSTTSALFDVARGALTHASGKTLISSQ